MTFEEAIFDPQRPLSLTPREWMYSVEASLAEEEELTDKAAIRIAKQEEKPVVEVVEQKEDVIQEPKAQAVESEPAVVQSQPTQGGDLMTDWQGILQNIESIPSRMFFYNLSRPVSLSAQEIVITFAKDIFVKQAKEETKNKPLKTAALKYYGVSDINIQVRLADHNDLKDTPKPSLEKLEKKPAPMPKKEPEVLEEEENAEFLKETLDSSSQKEKDKQKEIEALSDQSKMVMELFNGKYID